jgi:hypothetical protein
MESSEFQAALERTQLNAREHALCMMCAEAQWWRCHRRLISDALVIRGWRVLHLGLGAGPLVHELTPFAVVGEHYALTYPPAQLPLGASQLALEPDGTARARAVPNSLSSPTVQLALEREPTRSRAGPKREV